MATNSELKPMKPRYRVKSWLNLSVGDVVVMFSFRTIQHHYKITSTIRPHAYVCDCFVYDMVRTDDPLLKREGKGKTDDNAFVLIPEHHHLVTRYISEEDRRKELSAELFAPASDSEAHHEE
ncbi:hypothetical protein [Serratia fonticola]